MLKKFLRKKLIMSLIGAIGFLASFWYLLVCFMMTIHDSFSQYQNIPLLSFIVHLPSLVYHYTNIPLVNLAWQNATIMPLLSTEFTRDHLILIATAAACGLFGGMAGDYNRARTKINKFKNEASDELLRRDINHHHGIYDMQSVQNELRILIESQKSWQESWWGILFIAILGGVILALILKPFGLN